MAYVYILMLKDGSYYTGSCVDFTKRLINHEKGCVKSTKHKLPFEIKYVRKYEAYSIARKEENRIKRWKSRKSIENLYNLDDKNIAKKFGPIV